MKPIHTLAVLPALLAACGSRDAGTAGPAANIPVFAAEDPAVNTPGFVAKTLRLSVERFDTRYTMMAYVVGDKLTLGAMAKGPFRGKVHWLVGSRKLSVAFDAAAPGKVAKVDVSGDKATLAAAGAAFDGTAWTNIEMPANWVADGTPLQLTFTPDTGVPIVLPEAEARYVVKLETK
jgi:hypothetical protein